VTSSDIDRTTAGGAPGWDHPRLGLSLVLFAWGWWLAEHPGGWTLGLDDVNLAIHETGHLVFSPFGEWMTVAGGTLFQLLVPLVFAAYFWRRGDRHAATVPLWWMGQNCFGIARYISDARAQELPLVGGGEHLDAVRARRAAPRPRDRPGGACGGDGARARSGGRGGAARATRGQSTST
jgi:hypothetical protein